MSAQCLFAGFSGPIDEQAEVKIGDLLSEVESDRLISELHLRFESNGGKTNSGIRLYELLSRFPKRLAIYNASSVQSAGVLAFLGAKERFVAERATFVTHAAIVIMEGAPAEGDEARRLAEQHRSDKEIETILAKHLVLSQEEWCMHRLSELRLNAADAERVGLAAISPFPREVIRII